MSVRLAGVAALDIGWLVGGAAVEVSVRQTQGVYTSPESVLLKLLLLLLLLPLYVVALLSAGPL
jgi:hypothetical protein